MVFLLAIIAALLFSVLLGVLARRHRTVFDEAVADELLRRIDRLQPGTRGRWGRMSVAQMLHHLSSALHMASGELAIPRKHSPLSMFPLKQLVLRVFPFPKDAPTAPALIARDEFVFADEQIAARDRLRLIAKTDLSAWPAHPIFGPMTREEWGVLIWKHTDHHLRQFGA